MIYDLFIGGMFMKALVLKDLREESKLFTALWEFMKSHGELESDEDYSKVIDDTVKLVSQCDSEIHDFATEMAICVASEILRRADKKQEMIDEMTSKKISTLRMKISYI